MSKKVRSVLVPLEDIRWESVPGTAVYLARKNAGFDFQRGFRIVERFDLDAVELIQEIPDGEG